MAERSPPSGPPLSPYPRRQVGRTEAWRKPARSRKASSGARRAPLADSRSRTAPVFAAPEALVEGSAMATMLPPPSNTVVKTQRYPGSASGLAGDGASPPPSLHSAGGVAPLAMTCDPSNAATSGMVNDTGTVPSSVKAALHVPVSVELLGKVPSTVQGEPEGPSGPSSPLQTSSDTPLSSTSNLVPPSARRPLVGGALPRDRAPRIPRAGADPVGGQDGAALSASLTSSPITSTRNTSPTPRLHDGCLLSLSSISIRQRTCQEFALLCPGTPTDPAAPEICPAGFAGARRRSGAGIAPGPAPSQLGCRSLNAASSGELRYACPIPVAIRPRR